MNLIDRFWEWYNRHYAVNVSIAFFLFLLQLFHLYWLFTDVVLFKLTGHSYFYFNEVWGRFSVVFDYTEIPALFATTLVYLSQLRQKFSFKPLLFLLLVNTQWLHLLWITDQFVVDQFHGATVFHWSGILAWCAILIDFLELPVMFDTARSAISSWREKLAQ